MVNYVGKIIDKPIRKIFRKAGTEIVYNKLIAPYFSNKRPQLMLAAITALNGVLIGSSVYFNYLWRDIMNNLAARNLTGLTHNLESFAGLATATTGLAITRSVISQKLKLSWSNWAKDQAVKQWLSPENRHRLVTKDAGLEPEQRIPNDISSLVNTTEPLTIGFLSEAARAGAFSIVLFNISPVLFAGVSTLGAIGTWALHRGGRNLVQLNHEFTTAQNAYRNALVNAQEHGQSIALWGGEQATQTSIHALLQDLNTIGEKTIRTNARLAAIQSVYDNMSYVAPFALIAPAYFRPTSKMDVGDASLSNSASSNLRSSLDWYSRNQMTLVEWRACSKRLSAFLESCNNNARGMEQKTSLYRSEVGLGLSIKNLVLLKPKNGIPHIDPVLCKDVSFELKAGDRMGLTGEDGCGKTTFFRILAGIHPYEDGEIKYSGVSKNNGDVLFVPQDPFIPDAPLDLVLAFPKSDVVFSNEAMGAALEKVGLGHIAHHLGDKKIKGNELGLSGGEKQRLNFARLLLHKPRIIGLDEATSATTEEAGIELHRLLFRELPDSIIVNIVKREELLPLHNIVRYITSEGLSLSKPEPQEPRTILAKTAAEAGRLTSTAPQP